MLSLSYHRYLPSFTSACTVSILHLAHISLLLGQHLMLFRLKFACYDGYRWFVLTGACQPSSWYYCPQKVMVGMHSTRNSSSPPQKDFLTWILQGNAETADLDQSILSGATWTVDEFENLNLEVSSLCHFSWKKKKTSIDQSSFDNVLSNGFIFVNIYFFLHNDDIYYFAQWWVRG